MALVTPNGDTIAAVDDIPRRLPHELSNALAACAVAIGAGAEEQSLDIPDRRAHTAAERFLAREEVGQLLQRLDARERDVVRGHFGLDQSAPATYDQLARRLGLTRERVRQIERVALAKLRGTSAPARS